MHLLDILSSHQQCTHDILDVQVIEGQAAVYRCKATLDFLEDSHPTHPATATTAAEYELMQQVGVELLGKENVILQPPVMGVEDFAFFLQKVPGAFFFIGAGDKAAGDDALPSLHSPHFTIDEAVLPHGATLLAVVAQRGLQDQAALFH